MNDIRLNKLEAALLDLTTRQSALQRGEGLAITAEGFRFGSTRLLEKLVTDEYHLLQRDSQGVETDLAAWGSLGVIAGTGLNIIVRAGRARIDQTIYNFPTHTHFALLAASTYRVYVSVAGVITAAVVGAYPLNAIPLAVVVTGATTLTSITDERCLHYEDTAAGAAAPHAILDGGVSHTDTALDAVSTGSIIIGNATPAWDELVIAVPAANVRNVLGIDNAETVPSWKTALDATHPADIAAAATEGTSLVFSHRDHVHAHPVFGATDLHPEYMTPAEHTAIGDAAPHHRMGPPGLDGEEGEPGPPGQPGVAGAAGATGAAGPMGSMGPPGLDGEDGIDGFPGPVGAIGATGLMGPVGIDGGEGEPGEIGPPGPTGAAGAAGSAGAAGVAGPMGPPGIDGLDGEPGIPGPPGVGGGITELFTAVVVQNITAAADTITATDGSPDRLISSDAAYTMSSQPTIAAGRNGQAVYLHNVGTFNIILQDVNALGGSLLRLTANTLTIQPGGTLGLLYDSTLGFWIEIWLLNPQAFVPSISLFTIDGSSAATREVAAAATADAVPAFVMAYVGTPSACSINIDAGGGEINPGDYPIAVPAAYLLLNGGTAPPSLAFYRGTAVGMVRTFTATATVAGTPGLTRNCTATYINRRYMGPSAEAAALTTADVLGLDGAGGTSDLSTIRTGTFSVTIGGGTYLWYAYRAALGTGDALYLSLNTEIAEFIEKQIDLDHTNDYGFVEHFDTRRATTAAVGAVTAIVSTTQPNNRFYMGPAANGTDTIANAEILALDDTAHGESGIYSTQARTWTAIWIEAGEYLWYCHPDRVADLATIKDGTTGFAIAGSYRNNVNHTNQYGYVEVYRCWRSDNSNIYPAGENIVVT